MINESGWMLSELLTCFQALLWFRKQRLIRGFYHFYPLINIYLFCSHHLMIFLCFLITRRQIHQRGESLREERSADVWQAVSSNWNSRLWSNIKETLANKERLHRGAPLCTRDPCSLGAAERWFLRRTVTGRFEVLLTCFSRLCLGLL